MDSIAGTYCGVLPPNVETTLTLNADGTYSLKKKYLNESDSCEVLNGIFKVIDGSILMLEHPSSGDNIFYKVKNDSSIVLIDSFGNEPEMENVIGAMANIVEIIFNENISKNEIVRYFGDKVRKRRGRQHHRNSLKYV